MVDETDVKIINHILETGNARCVDIAKSLGVSGVTVHNRLSRLKKTGALKGMVPELNLKEFGYDITALIHVTVAGPEQENIFAKYATHKNICAIYDVSGQYDTLMIGKFRDTDELSHFVNSLKELPGVKRTNTSIVFRALRESVLPAALG